MRKVFRIWDVQEKQMSDSFEFTQSIRFKWGQLQITHVMEPRFITMCWTGLKDKNGKEIYESDLLEDEFGDIYEVRWNKHGCFEFGSVWASNLNARDFVVIGNKFENSKLEV